MFSQRLEHFLPARQQKAQRQLSQQDLEELQYAFDLFDRNKTGRVSAREVKVALRALGFSVKKKDVLEAIEKHSNEASSTATVDALTFKKIVGEHISSRGIEEEFTRAFKLFDVEESGKVELKTLRKIVHHLGMHIETAELKEMIDEFDKDQDGAINEQEFLAIMQHCEEW